MIEKSPTNDPTITNPKDAIGSNKIPFHLWPTTATALGSLALLDGALKYGRANFRAIGVRASIYVDALERHIKRWFEGEDADPDSGLPHLAHALACLAILADAQATGVLNDDRQFPGGFATQLAELTPHVARLKAKYADKSPKHFTIQDAPQSLEGAGEIAIANYDEWMAFKRWQQGRGAAVDVPPVPIDVAITEARQNTSAEVPQ